MGNRKADLKKAAAALGRLGGLSKSRAKSEAARLNGAKGGRPRMKRPRPSPASQP